MFSTYSLLPYSLLKSFYLVPVSNWTGNKTGDGDSGGRWTGVSSSSLPPPPKTQIKHRDFNQSNRTTEIRSTFLFFFAGILKQFLMIKWNLSELHEELTWLAALQDSGESVSPNPSFHRGSTTGPGRWSERAEQQGWRLKELGPSPISFRHFRSSLCHFRSSLCCFRDYRRVLPGEIPSMKTVCFYWDMPCPEATCSGVRGSCHPGHLVPPFPPQGVTWWLVLVEGSPCRGV